MEDQVTFRVTGVDAAEAEQALEGVDNLEPEMELGNLGVLEGIVMIGAAIAAGKFVINLWKQIRGGTVIDLTKKPPDIRRDRDLDWGFFMVIAEDGKVTVEAKDEPEDALERMVTSVLKIAADATVETVKAAIEKFLPADKVVTGAATP